MINGSRWSKNKNGIKQFFNELLCFHNYEYIKINGFWFGDTECEKCKKWLPPSRWDGWVR